MNTHDSFSSDSDHNLEEKVYQKIDDVVEKAQKQRWLSHVKIWHILPLFLLVILPLVFMLQNYFQYGTGNFRQNLIFLEVGSVLAFLFFLLLRWILKPSKKIGEQLDQTVFQESLEEEKKQIKEEIRYQNQVNRVGNLLKINFRDSLPFLRIVIPYLIFLIIWNGAKPYLLFVLSNYFSDLDIGEFIWKVAGYLFLILMIYSFARKKRGNKVVSDEAGSENTMKNDSRSTVREGE